MQGESPDNPDARDEAEGHEDGSKAKENDGDNEDFGSAVLHGVTAHLGKCEKSMAARDIQNSHAINEREWESVESKGRGQDSMRPTSREKEGDSGVERRFKGQRDETRRGNGSRTRRKRGEE